MADISRVAALKATEAGAAAAEAGEGVDACPHSVSGDLADEFAAHYWLKGYRDHAQRE